MDANNLNGQSLTRILITALGYSEDLTRSLEQIKRENDRLRLETRALKAAADDSSIQTTPDVSIQASQPILEQMKRENESLKLENQELHKEVEKLNTRSKPDISAQVNQLFQQNAEKQAEIDHLKIKLRHLQAKERKWRLRSPDISSPIVSSPDRMPRTPVPTSPQGIAQTQKGDTEHTHGVRKRLRTHSPEPKSHLREISINLPEGGRDVKAPTNLKPKQLDTKGAEAIYTLAEDGEDHIRPLKSPVENGNKPDEAACDRLQDLLTGKSPGKQLIPRPNTADSNLKVRQPQFQFLPVKSRTTAGPEDAEPFRSRPLHRQNLSHFKLNPNNHDGRTWAFNEVVRNQDARKCLAGCTNPVCCGGKFKAIAASLPRGTTDISDEEILLEFMGPGSEAKIESLTPLARKNLVHEARARRIANSIGKMHRSAFERQTSPTNFWDVDVLCSQEERESREQAGLNEREQVEKRFQEAMKENGRWVFADE